jgi:hypothetical protein
MEFTIQFKLLHEITNDLSFLGIDVSRLETKEPFVNFKGVNLGLLNIRNTNLIFKKLQRKFKIDKNKELSFKMPPKEREDTISNLLYEQHRQLQKIDTLLDEIGFEDYYIHKQNRESQKVEELNIVLSHKIIKRLRI